MRRVLVTGAGGFVGKHLAAALVERGYDVVGCGRSARAPDLPASVGWLAVDLLDPLSVATLARDYWGVVHLAAESVPARFSGPRTVLDNLAMLLNLCERLASGRMLYVSSCHVYAPSVAPCRETDAVRPQGRYGLSKELSEHAALAARHLDVRIARPFNHLGRGMHADLAVPSIVRRVRAVGDGPLTMQGLDSVSDFLDVDDIVRAYVALLELELAGDDRVFNVCSGVPVSIRELAGLMLATAGTARSVVFEKQPMSRDDTARLVGDPGRLRDATGWRPLTSLTASVKRLMRAN